MTDDELQIVLKPGPVLTDNEGDTYLGYPTAEVRCPRCLITLVVAYIESDGDTPERFRSTFESILRDHSCADLVRGGQQ